MQFYRLIIKHELDEFGEYEELFFVTESAAISEFRRRLNNEHYDEEEWYVGGDMNVLSLILMGEDGYNTYYKIECINVI